MVEMTVVLMVVKWDDSTAVKLAALTDQKMVARSVAMMVAYWAGNWDEMLVVMMAQPMAVH